MGKPSVDDIMDEWDVRDQEKVALEKRKVEALECLAREVVKLRLIGEDFYEQKYRKK